MQWCHTPWKGRGGEGGRRGERGEFSWHGPRFHTSHDCQLSSGSEDVLRSDAVHTKANELFVPKCLFEGDCVLPSTHVVAHPCHPSHATCMMPLPYAWSMCARTFSNSPSLVSPPSLSSPLLAGVDLAGGAPQSNHCGQSGGAPSQQAGTGEGVSE